MTYSIVARDPETGELGVAVQTRVISVGAVVTWAEAGVGAIATQAMSEIAFGPLGLDHLRAGAGATAVIRDIVEPDPVAPARQVGVIDASGQAAAFTGGTCVREAGHVVGDGFAVQANMMRNDTVWEAMAAAFDASSGPLPYRLLAALDAAQAEGGDLRGQQAAALLVVEGARPAKPGHGKVIDVRVDDHADPLGELRRLVDLDRAYSSLRRALNHIEVFDLDAALQCADHALQLKPDLLDAALVQGGILLATGREADARAAFARFGGDRSLLREYAVRYAQTGTFPVGPEAVARAVDGK